MLKAIVQREILEYLMSSKFLIGLGLTIVQQIVQGHHGEIRVAESESGGACFDIRFNGYDEGGEP